jgi:2-methylisocitrate lyase-like PEP mutase family enzyme
MRRREPGRPRGLRDVECRVTVLAGRRRDDAVRRRTPESGAMPRAARSSLAGGMSAETEAQMSEAGRKYRELLNRPGPVLSPGVYDCLTAKIVERAGFPMASISGAAVTASILGYPDVGLQTMPEILNQARNIARCVDIPIVADADTGYGNALNVMRTVREFEAAGLAGIILEDQTFPKKCGHFEGKNVISPEEMVVKIQAACEARRSDDFVIGARTDSRATHGIDDAIERACRYAEAGADTVFADGLVSVEDLRRFAQETPVHAKANLHEDSKTPMLHFQELFEMGYKVIGYSGLLQRAAIKNMFDVLDVLKAEGTTLSLYPSRIIGLTDRSALLGLDQFYELEERLYGPLLESEGSWRKELEEKARVSDGTARRSLPV